MSNCDSCPSKGKCDSNEASCSKIVPKYGNIKHIIGVISGKGGVGKSTVTGILATKLKKAGYKVGVLDADITGPSMPRFFGINEERAYALEGRTGEEIKFLPVETSSGIKVMSLNLLTEHEEEPVIWRGPVITGVLTQMYTDTEWGELDYLLIDMPPGTGDVALTIMQSIPVEGMVVVSTAQDMVSMIVKKVIIMAKKMNINVLGVVENMSYVRCSCGEKNKFI
jgi:Mrp family chromosome partitioning ATPase